MINSRTKKKKRAGSPQKEDKVKKKIVSKGKSNLPDSKAQLLRALL